MLPTLVYIVLVSDVLQSVHCSDSFPVLFFLVLLSTAFPRYPTFTLAAVLDDIPPRSPLGTCLHPNANVPCQVRTPKFKEIRRFQALFYVGTHLIESVLNLLTLVEDDSDCEHWKRVGVVEGVLILTLALRSAGRTNNSVDDQHFL